MNDITLNLLSVTKGEKFFKLYNKQFPVKQIKQLLKTFKKGTTYKVYYDPDSDLVVTWQYGKSEGRMTFYGYNLIGARNGLTL